MAEATLRSHPKASCPPRQLPAVATNPSEMCLPSDSPPKPFVCFSVSSLPQKNWRTCACLLLSSCPTGLCISCLHVQAQHLLPPFPGSASPSRMPGLTTSFPPAKAPSPMELGEAQGAPKRDTQKPGQPPSCFSAPICAPIRQPCFHWRAAQTLSGQQKAMWSPSIPAGSSTFPGGVRAGPAGQLGGSSPQFSAHHGAATTKMASPWRASCARAFADKAFRFPHQIRDNGGYLT